MSHVVGRVFDGRYVISRLLGRGGMGVVYLARQIDPARQVVIKMLSPSLRSDPQAIERFEREAKRLQELEHPNIVRFLGYGYLSEDATNYLVMEYVDGEVLSDVLAQRGKLGFDELVPIASQVLKAVGHVHARNVLIRDIKPSNVMLCEQHGRANYVKLLDFGLARMCQGEGEPRITTGFVLGTEGYIAPEVLRGEEAGLRADVYSLGVMFYLALSGQLPYDRRDKSAAAASEAPPHLSTLVDDPTIPSGFLELIHRCLDENPRRRPRDASTLMEEMIDVVPASFFRLPRAQRTSTPSTGSDALRLAKSADSFPSPRSPSDFLRPADPSPTLPTLPTGAADPSTQTPISQSMVLAPPPRRLARAIASIGTAAVVAGLVATGVLMMRPSEAAVSEAPAAPAAPPAIASATVDQARVAAVTERLREAERAAARGDGEAALEAYLDVLELEPGHRLAQTGLERVRETLARAEADEARAVTRKAEPAPEVAPPAADEAAPTPAPQRRARSRSSSRSKRRSVPAAAPSAPADKPAPTKAVELPSKGGDDLLLSSGKAKKGGLLPVN